LLVRLSWNAKMRPLRFEIRFFALAALAFEAAAGTAQAEEMAGAPLRGDRVYLGIDVGPIIPEGMSASLSGALAGSGRLSFNAAGAVGGFAGYRFSDRLAAEGEIAWALYDPFKLSGSFVGPGGPISSLALNGDFNTVLATANAIYRPLGGTVTFVPYLGAGLGFAWLDWSASAQPGAAFPLDVRGSAVDFAADAVAGVDYALSARLSLGGRYRYLWIDSGGGRLTGGGVTLAHGDVHAHVLTATATYRF
jgi:opacity protein-like surface antigen